MRERAPCVATTCYRRVRRLCFLKRGKCECNLLTKRDRTGNGKGLAFQESYGLTTVKRPYPMAPGA